MKSIGGYESGKDEPLEVDTANLDVETARSLERVLFEIGFFNMPVSVSGKGSRADQPRYEVTADDGAKKHTVAFDDDGTPKTQPLRDLLNAMRETSSEARKPAGTE